MLPAPKPQSAAPLRIESMAIYSRNHYIQWGGYTVGQVSDVPILKADLPATTPKPAAPRDRRSRTTPPPAQSHATPAARTEPRTHHAPATPRFRRRYEFVPALPRRSKPS